MVCIFSRELTSVEVECVEPKGGYYMFPNFEIIRKALTKRGIYSGQDMCQLMLKEANVAVSHTFIHIMKLLNNVNGKPKKMDIGLTSNTSALDGY